MKHEKRYQLRNLFIISMILIMVLSLTACAKNKDKEQGNDGNNNQSSGNKIVNIGVTDPLSSVNPLLMDATEILKYALSLEFLPLVELNSELDFVNGIASSITTEDNLKFTIKIDEAANWSDGNPITAEDVEFTILKLASPTLANVSMALYAFEGLGDDGFAEPGATEISGVKVVDSKTLEITTKYPMALTTFENTYARYILTIPKHILKDVADEQLAAYEWFSAPTVVSGPYRITGYDLQHYVSYEANDKYWKGAPKINKLNIRVSTPAQLLTGLQSGEIDFVQQTMGNILQEDYAAVEALKNVTVHYGSPITNQSIFFNTESVTDVRIRQAILHGIDRKTIIEGFYNGKGEVVDGFLSSASPFFSSDLAVTEYDPEKAKSLLEEAKADGWDENTVLSFYVNSGDSTFTQAADFIAAKLLEIGIKVQINPVDISSLLTKAGSKDFDILAVQYTYAPVDPYPDVNWLLSEGGWTGYYSTIVDEALAATQITSDVEAIKAEYLKINRLMQEEAPMISAYIISAIGAVNNRLVNAVPNVYGSFINIHEWDVK